MRLPRYALYLLLIAAAGWLVWRVRDMPLGPPWLQGMLRVDSLSAFFVLLSVLVSGGLLLLKQAHPAVVLIITALLVVASGSASLLVVVLAYLLITLVDTGDWLAYTGTALRSEALARARSAPGLPSAPVLPEQPGRGTPRQYLVLRSWFSHLNIWLTRAEFPRLAFVVWSLLPVVCLWLAYSALAAEVGTWYYNTPAAGAGQSSFTFWFVLLATLLGAGRSAATLWFMDASVPVRPVTRDLLPAIAWFYPLARLYSLGPWNPGWHLATLLLGGAVMIWAAWRAFRASTVGATGHGLVQMQFGLALAGIGLGTGAGLVAGCYALCVAPLLALGLGEQPGQLHASRPAHHGTRHFVWLLSGALPLTAPFVAAWMGIGAAAAGGMFVLAGLIWLSALVAALAIVQLAAVVTTLRSGLTLVLAGAVSVALGVLSPVLVQLLLRPVVQQLQGGLTPFGDIVLWPWGGLTAVNSARQQVAALPSMTIVALMLVLGALTWLLLRLIAALRSQQPVTGEVWSTNADDQP